ALSNAVAGQFVGMFADLPGGPQAATYTRFCFNVSGLTGSTPLAQGRNSNGKFLWEVDYDASRAGLDAYFWNGVSTTSYPVYSATNVVALNTWYCAEVQMTESTTGTGQVWLNGSSIGSVSADLSASANYSRLYLWNSPTGGTGTAYFDDIKVADTLSGPVGTPAIPTPTPTS